MKKVLPYAVFFLLVLAQISLPTNQLWGQDTTLLRKSPPRSSVNYAMLSRQKEAEIQKIVQRLKKVSPEEHKHLNTQLKIALDQLFELNLKKRESELRNLESELEGVQRGLDQRRINKDAIVKKRMQELLKGGR